jgi:hypothetical protein
VDFKELATPNAEKTITGVAMIGCLHNPDKSFHTKTTKGIEKLRLAIIYQILCTQALFKICAEIPEEPD